MIPDLIGLKSKLIAGGVGLAIMLAVFGAQEWRISDFKSTIKAKDAEISKLSGDLAVAQGNVATLKASISTQNKALEALKAEKAALDASVREKALTAQQNRGQTLSIDGEGVDSMNNFFERLFK